MEPSRSQMLQELRELLLQTTATDKHSRYQKLPDRLAELIDMEGVGLKPKFEEERLAFLAARVPIPGRSVLDIGCNTGYFSFALAQAGAARVEAYEGSPCHYQFCRLANEILGLTQRVHFRGGYFDFTAPGTQRFDLGLLLNVMHHVGDDYGDVSMGMDRAKQVILEYLNAMSFVAETLFFQMGFNWKGNIKQCLFEHGTKREMIDYISGGIGAHWDIVSIGVAEKTDGVVQYCDVNEHNVRRIDALGEFLNRPLFVLRSKRLQRP